ncbi:hypothetical protein [Rhizobacter sp. Root1221]|uniref:phage nozzle protein n=1 Tax=Rhizobacter sp. Root1221 TaxID=1736433 RepID=UPI0006F6ACE1|nr:hypothetical protein [Rhizobacter sp. Root1221]KQW02214.1 hypothetical protein ASC87_13365 [Rhizobacter sp. Root1221]
MSLLTRSFPGLFGGVSQQIPAMRHATQCAEQDNALATLVDGLYKRHGTRHEFTLDSTHESMSVQGANGVGTVHTFKQAGELYKLLLVNGDLMLYSMKTGASQMVEFPSGKSYLSVVDAERDFRCVSVADYTFVVNRRKEVSMLEATTSSNPTNVGYVYVKTSVPKHYFNVTVNMKSVSVYSGDSPTNAVIANALAAQINAADPTFNAYVLANSNIVKVALPVGVPMQMVVSDTWGNQCLSALHLGVDTFAQLPGHFESGYVISVNGTADSTEDSYYVRWDAQQARWIEAPKPGIRTTLDGGTMPHQLYPKGDGTWVFERRNDWGKRESGDESSNPDPSFVGTSINGTFFFRNRLGFLAGDSVILSRAGAYFNFFSTTATQVLDTDPIDLGSTSEEVESLEWAVAYNKTLLVWANGKRQFVLSAGDILSPSTAQLQPSTTFECDSTVRPLSLGNRVMFMARLGSNSQVNLYKVSEDTVTNTAEDLTEHCPKYVPASPRSVTASTTLKAAVVVPYGTTQDLFIFQYATNDADQMTQKAWCRVVFNDPGTSRILSAHWESRKLYLMKHVVVTGDPMPGGRYVIETLDFEEQATDSQADFALRLDHRTLAPAEFTGSATRLAVPYIAQGGLTVVKCVSGAEPVELTPTAYLIDSVNKRTLVDVQGNHQGATVYVGRKFNMRYTFTEVFMRDQQGVPVMHAAVKLARVMVRYVGTGWFNAKVTPALRQTYTYPFSGRTVGQPGQGASELALSSGDFSIPVQAKAAGTAVTIESDSWFPCKFPYAEWVGDVTMKASR